MLTPNLSKILRYRSGTLAPKIMQIKTILITILSCLLLTTLGAQNAVERLIKEGIFLYDNGQYEEATKKYKEALNIDAGNLYALYELAYTYEAQEKYDAAISTLKIGLKQKKAPSKIRSNCYVAYGNCLDKSNNYKKAIKIYKKGLKEFPDYYLLHFNLGVSAIANNDLLQGEQSFQQSLLSNPHHGSSHFYLALVIDEMGLKVPALMAFSRFILLEPRGQRSEAARQFLSASLNRDVEQKDGKVEITLNLQDLKSLSDPNSFSSIKTRLNLGSALDHDDKYVNETEEERFQRKFKVICDGVTESKDKEGFYWEFYAPFFAQLYGEDYLQTFSNLIVAENSNSEWIKTNEAKVKSFLLWSEDFTWQKK